VLLEEAASAPSKSDWQLVQRLQALQAQAELRLAAHGGADAARHSEPRQCQRPLPQSWAPVLEMLAETA